MALQLTLLALLGLAEASFVRSPPVTTTVELPLTGITPVETPPPDVPVLRSQGKKMRRAVTSATVWLMPDNTCGYYTGNRDQFLTCNDGSAKCAITTTLGSGYIGCCNAGNCNNYHTTACVDMSVYNDGECGDGCSDNPELMLCTQSGTPFCRTLSMDLGAGFIMWMYSCDATSATTIEVLNPLYSGESDGRAMQKTTVEITVSDTTPSVTTATETATETQRPTLSSSSSSSATVTSAGSSATTSAGAAATAPADAPDEKKSTSHTGAIAGGVVGGVAGVAALAGLLLFFLKRHQKNAGVAAPTTPAMGDGAAGMPGGGVGGPPGMPPTPMTQPMAELPVSSAVPASFYSSELPNPTSYAYYPVPTGAGNATSPDQLKSASDAARMSSVSSVSAASPPPPTFGGPQATIYEADGTSYGAGGGYHRGQIHEVE